MNGLLGLLMAAGLAVSAPDNADVRNSVVKIHVTQRLPDFFRPWMKMSAREVAGSGVVISGRRILTNAHMVRYASQIFVQPIQSDEKLAAEVSAVAPGIDLALLRLEDESFFETHRAIPVADELPKIRDTVSVYGYPIGGEQIAVTEGIVSRIDFTQYNYDTLGLRVQVDAALNPGNSGGPAIANGKIAGIVFSSIEKAENIGYLIPGEEIEAFLQDVSDAHYDGKPRLFDELQTVENPALRAKLGLKKGMGGMMVTEPYLKDESYPLREWDVITQIGKWEIDSEGKVRVREDLRLNFQYFVPKIAKNGKVPLKVLRNGKPLDLSVPVFTERNRLVPYLAGKYPSYFIHGPIVCTTPSQELVGLLTGPFGAFLRARQSPLLSRQFDRPAFPGEQLVIFGLRMFPHRITKGYDPQTLAVVSHVNGERVKNLRHLVELLRDAKDDYIIFKFHGLYESLVFRRAELAAVSEAILADNGIRYQCSEDLRDIWKKDGGD